MNSPSLQDRCQVFSHIQYRIRVSQLTNNRLRCVLLSIHSPVSWLYSVKRLHDSWNRFQNADQIGSCGASCSACCSVVSSRRLVSVCSFRSSLEVGEVVISLGQYLKRLAWRRRNAFAYGQPETQKGDRQRGPRKRLSAIVPAKEPLIKLR